ncbi:hypothetical protein FH972_022100 [Carpinus fangiana]|uniref:Major facilitator superfamily (MFS) profile domain-containing protein n=1 Tax=Carpinus fangiana TaxID=176857 RepID=A0A5N6KR92_9ROSI|nr:hypothetical protein FH972_022100 [Carpinus fangiana]
MGVDEAEDGLESSGTCSSEIIGEEAGDQRSMDVNARDSTTLQRLGVGALAIGAWPLFLHLRFGFLPFLSSPHSTSHIAIFSTSPLAITLPVLREDACVCRKDQSLSQDMPLTQSSRLLPNARPPFPTTQLALLALVRLAEPIAVTSIFPYAWKLVLRFDVGDKDDAAFYAGLLISAFSIAEAATGMFWGGLSDRFGRKPILLAGCAGTILSLLIVGCSTSFTMALFGRILGGLLNGNIGVVQTMVAELVTCPEHEPKAYAIMPFIWSVGTIVGPAIGGYFSSPAETFPKFFSKHGLFGRFPYLLPNVICASILLVAIIAGALFVKETHPELISNDLNDCAVVDADDMHITSLEPRGASEHAPADLRRDSYGTFNTVITSDEQTWDVYPNGKEAPARSSMFTRHLVMLIIALGLFTYHSMTYDNLLPIFLQEERAGFLMFQNQQSLSGGLGLTTQQVGIILSFNGVIALLIQGVVFPFMVSGMGIWNTFLFVTFGHPFAYFIVPGLLLLSPSLVYPGIYACLAVRNLFSILAYPVLLILIKEASPGPSYLGRINGLAASTGAACRCLAAPIAGYLYSMGMKMDFTPLAWWCSAGVAVIGSLQAILIRRRKDTTVVRTLAHHVSRESMQPRVWRETVHIRVAPIEEEAEQESSSLLGTSPA